MSRYGYGDDDYYGGRRGGGGGGGGGVDRWDRDRFERLRARSRPRGGESIRIEEDDYYGRRGTERDLRIEVDEAPRRPGGRNYDPYPYDEERYEAPRRRRPDYMNDDPYYTSGRELAPYRPADIRVTERDYYEVPERRPARPRYVRRQTSLDFDDRRDRPRYGDRDEEERDVNVSVKVRNPEPPRAPEPPRRNDYDDYGYEDRAVFRERDREIYRRRRPSSPEVKETVIEIKTEKEKRKKVTAKFPKRVCHWRALKDVGYDYTEDEFFYYVKIRGEIEQDQIDVIIKQSKDVYFPMDRGDTAEKIDVKVIEAPAADDAGEEIIEVTTTKIIENPTEEEIARYERAGTIIESQKSRGRRSSSGSDTARRTQQYVESLGNPSESGRSRRKSRGPNIQVFEGSVSDSRTMVLPNRDKSRSRREIDEEIRRLESEKRDIRRGGKSRDGRSERGRDDDDDDDYDKVDDKDIRVERNDRGELQFERAAPKRSKSRRDRPRPTQRDVNAALFALT